MIIAEFGKEFLRMYKTYTSESVVLFYQNPKIYLTDPNNEVVKPGIHKARIVGSATPFNMKLGYTEFVLKLEIDSPTNIVPYSAVCSDPYTGRRGAYFRSMTTYLIDHTGWFDIVAADIKDTDTVKTLLLGFNSDLYSY